MQLVDLAHEVEVGRRHRPRQVVHRAARNADHRGLLGDAQLVITVDHRLAFSNPALLSAPSKKSFSSVGFADLGVQGLHVDRRRGLRAPAAAPEHVRSPVFELRLPGRDLVRVNIELIR